MSVKTGKKNFLKTVKKMTVLPKAVFPKYININDKRVFLTANRIDHIIESHPELKDKIDLMIKSIKSGSIRVAIKDKSNKNAINLYTNNDDEHLFVITIAFGDGIRSYNSIITARLQNIGRVKKEIYRLKQKGKFEDIIFYCLQ